MRNRYLDLLRAAAIVRVIVYHLFGWPWLSILLPAMGIMFALAGSLTAASLDRRAPAKVIMSRLRRLLPPLWLLGALAVPAMLLLGWDYGHGGDAPMSWRLGLWILPIGDPPGSDKGVDVWEPLWYIRAYLWFVILSPLLYAAYKKAGWAVVAAPIVLIAALDKTGFALPLGRADTAMWDFATYGACWMAGFAHHDGRLARVRPAVVLAASAVLGAAALYWLRGHPGEDGYDLNDVSESQALWSLAVVLVALRWEPSMRWLERARPLDRAVNLLNARAVTVYLWHNIAIAAVWPVLTFLTLDDLGVLDKPVDLAATLGLTALAVLAFGWAEDLAARRRPRLWPTSGPGAAPAARTPGRVPPEPGPGERAEREPSATGPRPEVTVTAIAPDPDERIGPFPDGKVAYGFARGGRSFDNPGTGRTVPPSGPEVAFVPGHGAPGHGAPGHGAPGLGAPGLGAPGLGAPGLGAPGLGAGVPRQSTASRTGDAGGGPGPDDEPATTVSWFGHDSRPES